MTAITEEAIAVMNEASSMLEAMGVQLRSWKIDSAVNWEGCRKHIETAISNLTFKQGQHPHNADVPFTAPGMTLRDYLAAQALRHGVTSKIAWPATIAEAAYGIADAMLKQREL
jgi:hypothetical protein